MIVNNVNLAAVGVKFSQYPTDNKPEVAFAGKSNVGKSSLINRLCRGGKAEFSTFQVAVGPRRDTKLFGHFFLCKPTALPQLAHIA